MNAYSSRPWLKHYDDGVPHSLEPYPDIGLHDLLREGAQNKPNQPILITSARLPLFGRKASVMTLGQLDRQSDALCAALIDMGLKKGDRVAIVLPNCTAFAVSYFAILKAGGVVAACNPTYPPAKMAHQINDCDAEFAVAMSAFYPMMTQIRPDTKLKSIIVTNIKEYLPPLARTLFTLAREKKEGHYIETLESPDVWLQDMLQRFDGQKPDVDVSSNDAALFQYTGGTTGISKGAVSTHKALVSNMFASKAWTSVMGTDYEKEIMLGAIPLFHVYGMVLVLSFAVTVGQAIALVVNPRDINDLVDIIATYKPTAFSGVPAMFNALLNHPRVTSGEVDLSCLKLSTSGSAPLPPAVQEAYEKVGGIITQGFGMSEAPTATHSNPIKGERRLGSIGVPWPDMEMRIVSLDDSETDMPVGEVGELVIYGPNIMQGYHKMPTETANALREKDGKKWLYTGDIARMDEDGYFYIVDRKKDMVLIGGFNTYPAQIENIIKEIDAVLEVAVAGIPHPEKEGQESLKAWIVLKPGASASEDDVVKHCEKYLAPYEIPRRISFVQELPKSAVGKVLRRELIKQEVEGRS